MRSRAQLRLQIREARTSDIVEVYAFTSAKKMASVLLRTDEPGRLRLYNKGAAEWVLQRCTSMYNSDGAIIPMTVAARQELLDIVETLSSKGLRCICLAQADLPLPAPARPPDFFR